MRQKFEFDVLRWRRLTFSPIYPHNRRRVYYCLDSIKSHLSKNSRDDGWTDCRKELTRAYAEMASVLFDGVRALVYPERVNFFSTFTFLRLVSLRRRVVGARIFHPLPISNETLG